MTWAPGAEAAAVCWRQLFAFSPTDLIFPQSAVQTRQWLLTGTFCFCHHLISKPDAIPWKWLESKLIQYWPLFVDLTQTISATDLSAKDVLIFSAELFKCLSSSFVRTNLFRCGGSLSINSNHCCTVTVVGCYLLFAVGWVLACELLSLFLSVVSL